MDMQPVMLANAQVFSSMDDDDVVFPSFLGRTKVEHIEAPRMGFFAFARSAIAGFMKVRSLGEALRMDATSEDDMQNGLDSLRQGSKLGGVGAGPASDAQRENVLVTQVTAAINAFRQIEGERMLCTMLEQLLGRSRQVLQAHGVAAGDGVEAKLMQRIAELEEANRRGHESHRQLQEKYEQLRDIHEENIQTLENLNQRGQA
jgi:hypothetical protein